MCEDEAAKLCGLDTSSPWGTPTGCLREDSSTVASARPLGGSPPEPRVLPALSGSATCALNSWIDAEFPPASFTPLAEGDGRGGVRSPGGGGTATPPFSEAQRARVWELLVQDPALGVLRGRGLRVVGGVACERGGPDPTPWCRYASQSATADRLPRPAIPVVLMVNLDASMDLGLPARGVVLRCRAPCLLPADYEHYGAPQTGRARRVHLILADRTYVRDEGLVFPTTGAGECGERRRPAAATRPRIEEGVSAAPDEIAGAFELPDPDDRCAPRAAADDRRAAKGHTTELGLIGQSFPPELIKARAGPRATGGRTWERD